MNKSSNSHGLEPEIKRSEIGQFQEKPIERITVEYKDKMQFSILNYGAIITDIHVPDKNGKLENIVLCYERLEQYIEDKYYIGAIIGRYANRIENGQFSLNETRFQLSKNSENHHIHGGYLGFNKMLWTIEGINKKADYVEIHMSHFSKSGNEGYPGNLKVNSYFKVCPDMLSIEINGISDEDGIFNPTHHSYFNLSGNENLNINSHSLYIDANEFIEIDNEGIATGKMHSVLDTDFDFRNSKGVEKDYDHCWVLYDSENQIVLEHNKSGRRMSLSTNASGIQVYTANDFGENNQSYFKSHHSICLEPECFPNSPNRSIFPDSTLKANTLKKFSCTYKFDLI